MADFILGIILLSLLAITLLAYVVLFIAESIKTWKVRSMFYNIANIVWVFIMVTLTMGCFGLILVLL